MFFYKLVGAKVLKYPGKQTPCRYSAYAEMLILFEPVCFFLSVRGLRCVLARSFLVGYGPVTPPGGKPVAGKRDRLQ